MAQILEQENQPLLASSNQLDDNQVEAEAGLDEPTALSLLIAQTLQESDLRTFSRRIYEVADGTWWFRVRHKPDEGPFKDPEEAERALTRHVVDCRMRNAMGVNFNWPRTWSAMRLARRSKPRHAVENRAKSAS